MLRRTFSAFFTALKITLRGEMPPLKHQALFDWTHQTTDLVEAVYQAADAQRLDQATRQSLSLRLDGRDTSMETVLATVKHHAATEYPYLLWHTTAHNLTAIYASNMNDHYRVIRLHEHDSLRGTPVQEAIAALAAHLEAIPPDTAART